MLMYLLMGVFKGRENGVGWLMVSSCMGGEGQMISCVL